MNLNEYIWMCFNDKLNTGDAYSITEYDIEEWIVEWYKDKYARLPPIWLVKKEGKKWRK